MKKITKRTVYETLIKVAEGESFTDYMTAEDLKAFAENELSLMAKKAEKAKERAAEKKAEGDALREVVQSVLTADYQTIADVTTQIEGEDVTTSKVQYRLNALVKAGQAEKEEVTLPAAEGKKARKVMAYRLVG